MLHTCYRRYNFFALAEKKGAGFAGRAWRGSTNGSVKHFKGNLVWSKFSLKLLWRMREQTPAAEA